MASVRTAGRLLRAARRRRGHPRPGRRRAGALPQPAGGPAAGGQRRDGRWAAVLGRGECGPPRAPCSAGRCRRRPPCRPPWPPPMRSRGGGTDPRLRVVPGVSRLLAVRWKRLLAGWSTPDSGRPAATAPSTTPASPTSAGPTRRSSPPTRPRWPPPGVRERRQPAALRRPRPAGTPLRHRRGHPRADQRGDGRGGARPPDPRLCGVQQRAAVPDRPGRAGPGRAGPRRRVRPVGTSSLLVSPTGTGWVDHPDRDRRVPDPRRHRHLLHPVRPLPLVPVGPEGRAGPQPVPAAAVGRAAAAGRPPSSSGARGCWSSGRAWAPGPARMW